MNAQATQDTFAYRIDAADAIVFVSSQWVRFAAENEAPELTEKSVIGRPIWRFIAGDETQDLYRELFRALRFGHAECIIPFRCDSPTIVRQMTLTLRSTVGGGIEFEGRLLQALSREPAMVFSRWAARSDELIGICSICRRLLVHGEWAEASEAIVRRRLFNDAPVPHLQETVCPACRRGITQDHG